MTYHAYYLLDDTSAVVLNITVSITGTGLISLLTIVFYRLATQRGVHY